MDYCQPNKSIVTLVVGEKEIALSYITAAFCFGLFVCLLV
jgi:hypothetical protein